MKDISKTESRNNIHQYIGPLFISSSSFKPVVKNNEKKIAQIIIINKKYLSFFFKEPGSLL